MKADPATPLDFRSTNSLWCSVLVETLVRLGLQRAVVCPGSRSAPLTFALARHPGIEAISVLDERSAAFLALGLAKQQGRPVALVCTSGTAGANFLPAVIEAHESEVPLLVLTADRPPELRDCRSGQTIDQQKIFGRFVRFHHELAAPDRKLALLRYLRQTAVHAYERALRPTPGPVHLNCPFRDPLAPTPEEAPAATTSGAFADFFAGIGNHHSAEGAADFRVEVPGRPRITAATRGVIVVGPTEPADPALMAKRVGRVSRALGWPVLADALSPVRTHARSAGTVVAHYEAILRNDSLAERLRPEIVYCVGGWPTGKVLRSWLQRCDPRAVMIAEGDANRDGLHLRCQHLRAGLGAWSAGFRGHRSPGRQARLWIRAEAAVRRILADGLAVKKGLVEPVCIPVLAGSLPANTLVFAASSMPVRDLEYFWPAGNGRQRFRFNRGANGIDGTLSTALGLAHGDGQPAVLLTGDLALLHDTNGFLSARRLRGSLTVVLINNRGGGIFEHLPVAQFDPPFEEFFATPQEAHFRGLCGAYGVDYVRIRDRKHLSALLRALPARGVRVLEVRTDRKKDAAFRKALLAGAAAEL
ncbi:MAG TPA: 2-succinyl-5-enolpyruvyl-6-hydroxy-3-cyclohexene-1-carboxylic-acid synthase [Candidatus Didemnitutus sp.]|jgi:2-succinyl-5-enolpyruvyl-6-hydroxy-3-cyclohexene-1-carboxylate synthase